MDHHHHQLSCKSILKRKSSETSSEDCNSSTTVINPEADPLPAQPQLCTLKHLNINKSYRQGILKKNSSSFDDESTQKPILKNRCLSCDEDTMQLTLSDLHSILKRKTSEPSYDFSSSEPHHGILKKRDMSVHQNDEESSDSQSHHQQITLQDDDAIRPILKQKKFESESTIDENTTNNYPKPILKKKSVDRDCSDDKKPILKSSRSNSPAKCSNSKRLSVAQRVSNLESVMHEPSSIYKKPTREHTRNSRDRSRFHTQPVTPSEIKAIKKYVKFSR